MKTLMRILNYIILCIALYPAVLAAAAESDAPVFTDPVKAGVDFKLQGEYVGEIDLEKGRTKIGIQVIALGDGKFRGVAYKGGLPGEGWSRDDEAHSSEGTLDGESVTFLGDVESIEAVLTIGKINVSKEGKEIGQLDKVMRESPTLGAKPPENATVLFDGRDTDAWEDGQIVEDKYLAATGAFTKMKYGDHRLHIEFRTPFMPKSTGRVRGNSGVYVQSRYEVQVLDSFGLASEENGCGGIYSVAKPVVNMCLPPLSWQTYDIDFSSAVYNSDGRWTESARITVRHNGIVIHDDLVLRGETPGRHLESPEPDGLFLQDHKNPVVFRNIWVVKQ